MNMPMPWPRGILPVLTLAAILIPGGRLSPQAPAEVRDPQSISAGAPPVVDSDGPKPNGGVRVAALVREALRRPDREETWACLALALSRLQTPESGESATSDTPGDAVSVADSLACSRVGLAAPASPGGDGARTPDRAEEAGIGGVFQALRSWAGSVLDEIRMLARREPWLPPVFLALGAVGLLGLAATMLSPGSGERGRRGTRRRQRSAGHEDSNPRDPRSLALALRDRGAPPSEIARRTGIAQDALSVLFAFAEPATPLGSAEIAPGRSPITSGARGPHTGYGASAERGDPAAADGSRGSGASVTPESPRGLFRRGR